MTQRLLSFTILLSLLTAPALQAETIAPRSIPVASGDTIAFLGDSITAAGARSGGYCQLVLDGLKRQGIEAKGVFAGISGHKSNQMLGRLDKHVLSKKPDWMTLSCGVNDVWHGARGVALEPYKTNITAIVEQAQAAGVKVMLLTSTMIRENQDGELNQKLVPYNAFLRALAVEKGCLIADLNAEMQAALKTFPANAPKGKQLTGDGVHMNAYGNMMMAAGILKAFGTPEDRVTEIVQDWKKAPGSRSLRLNLGLSIHEYETLDGKLDRPVQLVFEEFLNEKKNVLLAE